MYVIPSVDIKDGKCVKLVRGKAGTGREISDDPLNVAETWESDGAEILHVVDLDAAMLGKKGNRKIIADICRRVGIPVEVGGGIRSRQDAEFFIGEGARWVILGTIAVERPELVRKIARTVSPSHIIVALDCRKNRVLTEGWMHEARQSPQDILKTFERLGVAAYLYTDVEVEGTLSGINVINIEKLVNSTNIPIIYAGGVSSLKDLANLSRVGVRGAVVGRALYDGLFTLKEAMEAVRLASSQN